MLRAWDSSLCPQQREENTETMLMTKLMLIPVMNQLMRTPELMLMVSMSVCFSKAKPASFSLAPLGSLALYLVCKPCCSIDKVSIH